MGYLLAEVPFNPVLYIMYHPIICLPCAAYNVLILAISLYPEISANAASGVDGY